MNTKNIPLTTNLHKLLTQHMVLLEPLNKKNNRFKLEIWTGGYQDMIYTIGDLIKVSMLALEAGDSCNFPDIPNPNTNISGVLSLILNMLPYEEAELLDILHQSTLKNQIEEHQTPHDENYFLTTPTELPE